MTVKIGHSVPLIKAYAFSVAFSYLLVERYHNNERKTHLILHENALHFFGFVNKSKSSGFGRDCCSSFPTGEVEATIAFSDTSANAVKGGGAGVKCCSFSSAQYS